MGYQQLCLLVFDDPQLVADIFAAVGERLVRYYRDAVQHESVGAVWANASWGRYWGWDSKEVWSLIAFLAYLAILHLRIDRQQAVAGADVSHFAA